MRTLKTNQLYCSIIYIFLSFKKYSSMRFDKCVLLCQHHHQDITPKVLLCPFPVHPSQAHPWPQVWAFLTSFLSLWVRWPLFRISYIWNHTVCILLCLASHSGYFLEFIHVGYISRLFFLSVILHWMNLLTFVCSVTW